MVSIQSSVYYITNQKMLYNFICTLYLFNCIFKLTTVTEKSKVLLQVAYLFTFYFLYTKIKRFKRESVLVKVFWGFMAYQPLKVI